MELIRALSESQVEQIQDKTEEILEGTGLRITHPKLLLLCRNAGAWVDQADGTVRFPKALLRELLSSLPCSYTIASADGRQHVVGEDNQFCHAIVTDPWIVDYETQTPRRPRLNDLRRHTTIAQKLDPVVAISLMDFPVSDVEEPTSSLRAFEEHVLYHNKHILVYATNLERYGDWMEVAKILLQSDDVTTSRLMSVAVGMLSPLVVSDLNVEFLLDACAKDFPVIPTVCPIAGMTSPYTLGSTLLQGNVEIVGLAALTQIVHRGHPYLYAFGPSVGHMRSMQDMYYTLDKVLWKIAGVQLGKAYNMPVAAECGGSMTHRYDQQNGAEGILFMLAAAASKANILAGIGSTYNAVGMSAEMMVIHTAWLESARFLQRGITIDDEHLGAESLKRAGPGGHFLLDELTTQFLRSREFFSNELLDYSGSSGQTQSLLVRAHEQVEDMVSDSRSPHPDRVQEGIRRYFARRYRELGA
jgi:trimethylamine--corrinoid protein Co-methyltransferase